MEANTVLKAKQSSYQTRSDPHGNLWVNNLTNSLNYVVPKNLNYKINDHQRPETAKAFEHVFGIPRLELLDRQKERLSTAFALAIDGKILEVEFITAADTSLTIDEIEALEDALQKNLKFGIVWLDNNEADFISLNSFITWENILTTLRPPIVPEGSIVKPFATTISITPPLPKID